MRARGGILTVAVALGWLCVAPATTAQTCRWDGTAPYCAGECGPGESEEARGSAAHMVTHLPSVNHFGNGCVFGSKAYCCKSSGITCRWDGTAPLCDGECEADEKEVDSCESDSCTGRACWTGVKKKCCKAQTGSSGQRLEVEIDDMRYAAIWEKSSSPPWLARHGLTSARFQEEFEEWARKGYRLLNVNGYGVGAEAYYAAIWEKREGPAWTARHGMTSASFQQQFDELSKKGYRLIDISGYSVGGSDRYAGIWEKRPGGAWIARYRMTSASFQQQFDELSKKGYRLTDISGYSVGGSDRYAAIWEKGPGPAWTARHGMTSASFQQQFNDLGQQGYRLVHISGHRVAGDSRYAAIWEKASGPAWAARYGMTSDGYQEEVHHWAKEKFRPVRVSGF